MSKNNKNFFKKKNSWSIIKDHLLEGYLKPYFQKILKNQRTTYYVDCFAGKGRFDDGQDGSPLIALKIRNDCLEKTKRKDKIGAIEMCFIDMNYADDLRENIGDRYSYYGEPTIISGRYEDVIEECLKDRRGQNVFLYIDPYGINALDIALFDTFHSYGFKTFEMLINFNSFGFFRDACEVMRVDTSTDEAFKGLDDLVEYEPTKISVSEQSARMLSGIAGGDYWKDIVMDYQAKKINGYQAEQRLSFEYKKRLKQRYKYVLDMPIRLKSGQRPKYRMIHVSDHEDGCFLMAENMQRRKDELFLNIQQEGQYSLINYMPEYALSIEGEPITRDEVEEKVREMFYSFRGDVNITRFLAAFVNQFGLICDFNMIYEILDKMSECREIDIIRDPEYTETGRKSQFWQEKGENKVTLRRVNRE